MKSLTSGISNYTFGSVITNPVSTSTISPPCTFFHGSHYWSIHTERGCSENPTFSLEVSAIANIYASCFGSARCLGLHVCTTGSSYASSSIGLTTRFKGITKLVSYISTKSFSASLGNTTTYCGSFSPARSVGGCEFRTSSRSA